jgi:two-component system alkaline phosphatase synthesis response regulator PhoP
MKALGRVLVVEDDSAIAMTIRDRLESEGFAAEIAADGEIGVRRGRSGEWDVIILDLMLPKQDGLAVCRDLRDDGITTPLLMLTARDQTRDKVVGLETGADDYLTKPFEMAELIARVEALLRRSRASQSSVGNYSIGIYSLDLRRQQLLREGVATPLSTQEFKLLKYLFEHRGEVVSRDELLSAVWGYHRSMYTRTVDVHIAWLRRKLGGGSARSPIVTVRGRGYKLVGE